MTRRPLAALLGVLFILFVFGGRIVSLYVDYLWYESLGFTQVFFTGFGAGTVLFFLGALLFLAIFLPSGFAALAAARRLLRRIPARLERPIPTVEPPGPFGTVFGGMGGPRPFGDDRPRPFGDLAESLGGAEAARWAIQRLGGRVIAFAGVGLALVMGLAAASTWETVLRALNGTPFGVADPVFGYEVSFHVFTLPLLDALQSWLFWTVVLSIAAAGVTFFLALYAADPSMEHAPFHFHNQGRAMRTHLLFLVALLLLVLAAGFWVGMFDALLSRHDRLVGANYADVHARIPATQALVAATILTALLTLVAAFQRGYALPLGGAVLMVVAFVVGRGLLPAVVQRLQVEPAELQQETPYIASSIRYTRMAYGLDGIAAETFPAEEAVRPEEIRADPETVANIRLWDPRPLRDTFNQVQSIRPYYVFDDVDVDRYRIDGRVRQVMLSARELVAARLGQGANTWVNRRLQYTHGYGVAMSPVNEISQEGLPPLLIRDLPPTGRIPVRRPEVYYGEQTSGYVIVNSGAQEFDYPSGEQNVFTSFAGGGGVPVGSFFRRLALAWNFADFNLLISTYVRPDSKVLFRRNVAERVQRVAPFLKLDTDPYLVIADGELFWMLDGYTLTDRFPYAPRQVERIVQGAANQAGTSAATPQPGQSQQQTQPTGPIRRYTYNYIRNSAKITVSAYDGSVRVYLAEQDDPIARAYSGIFPGLFQPLSEMPASLREHVRYPEDLFRVQAAVLRAYHVQDPQQFYNGEDVWSLAFESADRQVVEPYYLNLRLPGASQNEFVLVTPFTPRGRQNMSGWLAARSDAPNYGKLQLYIFPRDRLVYGPEQIATRINQDPAISQQVTLWNQQGSRVVNGNLLVIPIGRSTLYVRPLYLVAEQSQLPELKRVIVATGNRVVMENTLDEALLRLFGQEAGLPGSQTGPAATGQPGAGQTGGAPAAPATPASSPGTTGAAGSPAAEQARAARETYQRAQEALRAGDFARFGEELRRLEEFLAQLERSTGP